MGYGGALMVTLSTGCTSSGVPERPPVEPRTIVAPVRETMRLRGMYTYMADAGRFSDCESSSTFPVAQVGDNAALERAYSQSRPEPGAPLLVSFRGHFEERPAIEGDRRIRHVLVDAFDRVWPGLTCGDRMSNATLENTYWKLLELGDRRARARVTHNTPEPNLRLMLSQNQARGSTGCNSFMGSYGLRGDSIRFGALASTGRACADREMSAQENAFLKALADTRTWQVTRDTLVLAGATGRLAKFSAQYMR